MLSHALRYSRRHLTRLSELLPSSCALCGSSGRLAACGECRRQFFGQQQTRCGQCACTLPAHTASDKCGECLRQPPAFDRTIVAADYAPPVDQLVLALKFGSRLAIAPLCAGLLHDALTQADPDSLPDLLTAVPLGSGRLRERGFNQALEIGKPFSRLLGIKLDAHLVMRQRDTSAQTLLHPDQRHTNIRNAFTVPGAAIDRVRDKHIGVIDDVITTGETLNELAKTLKRFGAKRVTNFVFARTPQK